MQQSSFYIVGSEGVLMIRNLQIKNIEFKLKSRLHQKISLKLARLKIYTFFNLSAENFNCYAIYSTY